MGGGWWGGALLEGLDAGGGEAAGVAEGAEGAGEVEAAHAEEDGRVVVDVLGEAVEGGGDVFAGHRGVGAGAGHAEVAEGLGEEAYAGFRQGRFDAGGQLAGEQEVEPLGAARDLLDEGALLGARERF